MKLPAYLRPYCGWMNLSVTTLVALLQRTPVLRVAAAVDEFVASSPVGTALKSAAAAAISLGAIDSMAGATLLATTVTQSPSGALPTFDATVGVEITPLGFTITNSINIASWTVTGSIPPGLHFTTVESPGIDLTGPGNLDATTPGTPSSTYSSGSSGNNTTTPILVGTPTTAGTYTFMIQGFAEANEKGGAGIAGFVGTGISSVFPFTVVVASATPAPTPTPTPVVTTAPVFTAQPISVTVTGGTVALSALASNSPTYQWMLNGTTPVQGGAGPILEFADATMAVGSYTCVATNSAGSATSSPATISLSSTTDIARLVNISCRAQVGTGSGILIVGFVVGGQGTAGSEPLLVRGSGPALATFGVAGTLPDPELQVYSGSTLIGMNDAWGGSSAIAAAAAAVGAFPWTVTSSNDSALLENLQGGPYTAQVSGQSNDSGVALAEVYDETPAADYTPSSPRLVNISARVVVGTGGNILIAGFAIGGSTSRTMLIRASGPALVPFGVPGTLPDPQLGLYSGSTLLDGNSGWGGNADIASAAAAVGAFAWSNPSSNDSAILVTLPPGAYTAQVSGASGDTGVALVEVYEVP
jgi:hypothetical protein